MVQRIIKEERMISVRVIHRQELLVSHQRTQRRTGNPMILENTDLNSVIV